MRRDGIHVVLLSMFFAFVFSPSIQAQTSTDEKVLIPVWYGTYMPGANGSVWVFNLTIRNDGSTFTRVGGWSSCAICVDQGKPHTTFTLDCCSGPPGLGEFVYVQRPGNELVSFNARIQDISRQSQTWGTEIPIVREGEWRQGHIALLDVPLSDEFRQALRVYAYDQEGLGVSARIYDLETDTLLSSRHLTLSSDVWNPADIAPQSQLTDLRQAFELTTHDPVRIELEPEDPTALFWAFVSVTNNETQHVTLVTPQ